MTTAKATEFYIIRRLLQRPSRQRPDWQTEETASGVRWADRLIAVSAVTVALFLAGSYLEELLWVVLATATIFALGLTE